MFLTEGSIFTNFEKKSLDPISLCKALTLFLKFKGIFGMLTKPSVKALKYKPVPPTKIGTFFLFFKSEILLLTNFSQSPVEKFFLTL